MNTNRELRKVCKLIVVAAVVLSVGVIVAITVAVQNALASQNNLNGASEFAPGQEKGLGGPDTRGDDSARSFTRSPEWGDPEDLPPGIEAVGDPEDLPPGLQLHR